MAFEDCCREQLGALERAQQFSDQFIAEAKQAIDDIRRKMDTQSREALNALKDTSLTIASAQGSTSGESVPRADSTIDEDSSIVEVQSALEEDVQRVCDTSESLVQLSKSLSDRTQRLEDFIRRRTEFEKGLAKDVDQCRRDFEAGTLCQGANPERVECCPDDHPARLVDTEVSGQQTGQDAPEQVLGFVDVSALEEQPQAGSTTVPAGPVITGETADLAQDPSSVSIVEGSTVKINGPLSGPFSNIGRGIFVADTNEV